MLRPSRPIRCLRQHKVCWTYTHLLHLKRLLVANQKAKYVVKALNRLLQVRPSPDNDGNVTPNSKPFEFKNRGSLAYIGGW